VPRSKYYYGNTIGTVRRTQGVEKWVNCNRETERKKISRRKWKYRTPHTDDIGAECAAVAVRVCSHKRNAVACRKATDQLHVLKSRKWTKRGKTSTACLYRHLLIHEQNTMLITEVNQTKYISTIHITQVHLLKLAGAVA
jgi:hypothetical protein